MASHSFLHTDLVGRHYMCFMLARSGRLQVVRLHGPDRVHKKGLVASIPARDAVVLQRMHLMAVLDLGGTLLLYSGCSLIGKVHVGGVLSSNTAAMSAAATVAGGGGGCGVGGNGSGPCGGSGFGTPVFPRRSSLLPTIKADIQFDDELHSLSPVQPLQHAAGRR